MSTKPIPNYQPNDIEVLIKNKSFQDLLPDEKEFVLQHMSSEEEFNQLKQLWNSIESEESDLQDPPKHIWKNLRTDFKQDHQKTGAFTIWLNSVSAWWRNLNAIGQFGISFASIAVIVATIWSTISLSEQNNEYAHLNVVMDVPADRNDYSVDSASKREEYIKQDEPLAQLTIPEVQETESITDDVEQISPPVQSDHAPSVREDDNFNNPKYMDSEIQMNSNQTPAVPLNAASEDINTKSESTESKVLSEKDALNLPVDSLKKKQDELKKKKKKK